MRHHDEDGLFLLVQVKQQSEVREPWDYFSIVSEIPGDQAYRPLSESECAMVRN